MTILSSYAATDMILALKKPALKVRLTYTVLLQRSVHPEGQSKNLLLRKPAEVN